MPLLAEASFASPPCTHLALLNAFFMQDWEENRQLKQAARCALILQE